MANKWTERYIFIECWRTRTTSWFVLLLSGDRAPPLRASIVFDFTVRSLLDTAVKKFIISNARFYSNLEFLQFRPFHISVACNGLKRNLFANFKLNEVKHKASYHMMLTEIRQMAPSYLYISKFSYGRRTLEIVTRLINWMGKMYVCALCAVRCVCAILARLQWNCYTLPSNCFSNFALCRREK